MLLNKYLTAGYIFLKIYSREGIKGLYRGWFSTMIRETQGYSA